MRLSFIRPASPEVVVPEAEPARQESLESDLLLERFQTRFRRSYYRLLVIPLLVGLINGLFFVFLVPPWQHNDEPNHFEYAWLIAERGRLPEPGDYDAPMRLAVAKSMIAHGFYRDMGFLPDLEAEPAWIGGYSQLTNSPLYYILAAVPIRLLPSENVTYQLYASRLFSLFLYLLTILAAWGIASELLPRGHPLQLLGPLTLALLPAFTDLMTSISNDVGAITFFSLSLWGAVRITRKGVGLVPIVLTAVAVILCYMTKETAYFALPVFLIALLFAVYQGPTRWVAWVLFGLSVVVISLTLLSWDDAAYWYRSTAQASPVRTASEKAVLGKYALSLDTSASVTPAWSVPLFQPVPRPKGGFPGKTFTLGAWIWADRPVDVKTPVLGNSDQEYGSTVSVGEDPQFFAFTVELPENASNRSWISLEPARSSPDNPIRVYYDGLVLAEGERPVDEAPRFDDPYGRQGVWGGAPFKNLLRNASAETAWFRFRTWVDDYGSKIAPDQTRPSLVLSYLFDWAGAYSFHRNTADRLFRTFWGMFGWGHVPLIGYHPYRILLAATIAGIAGACLALLRKRKALPWEGILLLALTLIAIWGMSFVRGAVYMTLPKPYIPVARYAYPAAIPTALLLTLGWWQLVNLAGRWLRLSERVKAAIYCLLIFGFNLLGILSIYKFYL